MVSILTRLKQETREHHDRAENNPVMRTVMSPALSRAEYAAVLQKFYGFYAPLEAKLAAAPGMAQLALDFDARKKVPRLVADLKTLGLSDRDIDRQPRCEALPALYGVPQILGCCYVLEGATLGGQLVSRHLRRTLGITPQRGGRFFSSYGADVGPMWRAFGEVVTGYAATATPAQREAMIDTARRTFAAFDRWLARGGTI